MTISVASWLRLLPVVIALALATSEAAAQKKQPPQQDVGVPNALQGFSKNKDQPVQIEAASLEVRDKDKVAIFKGSVVVTQGDTVMKCRELQVYYDQEEQKGASKGSMKAAKPGPGGKQGIRRLEALGGVVVTTKDQTATGEKGVFEMKTNTITLSGGVVITQGTNVLKGERLVVDLTTSHAKVEGGRVQGMFSTNKDSKPGKDDKAAGTSGQAQDGKKPAVKNKPTALPPPNEPAVTN